MDRAEGPGAAEFLERLRRQHPRIGDHYVFDFDACPWSAGWAQLDTPQDAWYFGTWADPAGRLLVTYAEGDITVQGFEDDAAFCEAVRKWSAWQLEHYEKRGTVDPGLDPARIEAWEDLGLADLFAGSEVAA